jgi:hypothetical protein
MRLKKRLALERLFRVRDRAHSARAAFAQTRTASPYLFAQRAKAVCGTFADHGPARRSTARSDAAGEISMRRVGSFGFEVPVRNVSAAGCSVGLVEPVAVNDRVIARLPGLEPLAAKVIWSDPHCAGLQFERPIHPAVFELLLERLA